LTVINLGGTGVSGDIAHLESLPNLNMIGLTETGVTVDKEAFNDYRKSAGLPYCSIYD
jgi:hypothetical protein